MCFFLLGTNENLQNSGQKLRFILFKAELLENVLPVVFYKKFWIQVAAKINKILIFVRVCFILLSFLGAYNIQSAAGSQGKGK